MNGPIDDDGGERTIFTPCGSRVGDFSLALSMSLPFALSMMTMRRHFAVLSVAPQGAPRRCNVGDVMQRPHHPWR